MKELMGVNLMMIAMILALVPVAAEDTSKPYRSVDLAVETTQSRDGLASCIAAELKAKPTIDGNKTIIALYVGQNVFTKGKNSFSVVIEDKGNSRLVTSLYRHPLSERSAIVTMRDVGKKCYKDEFNAAIIKHPNAALKPL